MSTLWNLFGNLVQGAQEPAHVHALRKQLKANHPELADDDVDTLLSQVEVGTLDMAVTERDFVLAILESMYDEHRAARARDSEAHRLEKARLASLVSSSPQPVVNSAVVALDTLADVHSKIAGRLGNPATVVTGSDAHVCVTQRRAHIVALGAPQVGKTTLLNALARAVLFMAGSPYGRDLDMHFVFSSGPAQDQSDSNVRRLRVAILPKNSSNILSSTIADVQRGLPAHERLHVLRSAVMRALEDVPPAVAANPLRAVVEVDAAMGDLTACMPPGQPMEVILHEAHSLGEVHELVSTFKHHQEFAVLVEIRRNRMSGPLECEAFQGNPLVSVIALDNVDKDEIDASSPVVHVDPHNDVTCVRACLPRELVSRVVGVAPGAVGSPDALRALEDRIACDIGNAVKNSTTLKADITEQHRAALDALNTRLQELSVAKQDLHEAAYDAREQLTRCSVPASASAPHIKTTMRTECLPRVDDAPSVSAAVGDIPYADPNLPLENKFEVQMHEFPNVTNLQDPCPLTFPLSESGAAAQLYLPRAEVLPPVHLSSTYTPRVETFSPLAPTVAVVHEPTSSYTQSHYVPKAARSAYQPKGTGAI